MMLPGFPDAQPLHGALGGVLIGLAAALMLLGAGRIASFTASPGAIVSFTLGENTADPTRTLAELESESTTSPGRKLVMPMKSATNSVRGAR